MPREDLSSANLHSMHVDLLAHIKNRRSTMVVHEYVDSTGEVHWTLGITTYSREALDIMAAVFGVDLKIRVMDTSLHHDDHA